MTKHNCFIFRTDSNEFVQRELKQGRLRQGWSPHGTSLLNSDGQERNVEEWKQAYQTAWGESPSPRRYGILRRMLNMKKQDIVICPKAPDYRHFTIAKANGSYRFEDQHCPVDDFGHIIPVAHQRVVSNCHNVDARTIFELFKSAYTRPAITQVQEYKNQQVHEAATRLLAKSDAHEPNDLQAIREQRYDEARRQAAKSLIENLNRNWSFDEFENAVGEAFRNKGYELIRSKSSRTGGDADHVFALPMPGFNDNTLLDYIPLVIVQVKHKQGIDSSDVDGVYQLLNWVPYEGEEVRFRVLFSSADSFSEPCRKLADSRDVILICGMDAGLFML